MFHQKYITFIIDNKKMNKYKIQKAKYIYFYALIIYKKIFVYSFVVG